MGHRAGKVQKGGKACKKTQTGVKPVNETVGVMLQVNAVQPPPVKWLKLGKMVLDVLDYEESSVLMHIVNMPR